MSNLHKDLPNDQIHEPKDFSGAANETKLTKNASGALEWVADTHPTDAVSQIVAGTDITISPTGGTGIVTINSTATGGGVSQIIAGTNVTISPTGGTGAVTINASGGGDFLTTHSFRGCYDFQGEGDVNWKMRGLTCGKEARHWNELGFTVDTGVVPTAPPQTITVPPYIAQGGTLHTVPINGMSLNTFSGVISSPAAISGIISLAGWLPNCEEPSPSSDVEVLGNFSVPFTIAANSYVCFDVVDVAIAAPKYLHIIPIISFVGTEPSLSVTITGTIGLK